MISTKKDTAVETEQKKIHYCPKCNSRLMDRIPRSPFVKLFLPWMHLKRYICYKCQHKTYVND